MSPEELDAIKHRANSATPGPWISRFDPDAAILEIAQEGKPIGEFVCISDYENAGVSGQDENNARFIAHSRTDIPLLLLEVERLRAEVERLQHQAIGLSESASKSLILYANAGTEADGLRAEVERLQEEIERLRVEGTSPKPGPSINSLRPAQDAAGRGFLTWLNQVADLLPVGTVIGVSIEELGRWYEAGMTARAAADELARSGQRVRGEGL